MHPDNSILPNDLPTPENETVRERAIRNAAYYRGRAAERLHNETREEAHFDEILGRLRVWRERARAAEGQIRAMREAGIISFDGEWKDKRQCPKCKSFDTLLCEEVPSMAVCRPCGHHFPPDPALTRNTVQSNDEIDYSALAKWLRDWDCRLLQPDDGAERKMKLVASLVEQVPVLKQSVRLLHERVEKAAEQAKSDRTLLFCNGGEYKYHDLHRWQTTRGNYICPGATTKEEVERLSSDLSNA